MEQFKKQFKPGQCFKWENNIIEFNGVDISGDNGYFHILGKYNDGFYLSLEYVSRMPNVSKDPKIIKAQKKAHEENDRHARKVLGIK